MSREDSGLVKVAAGGRVYLPEATGHGPTQCLSFVPLLSSWGCLHLVCICAPEMPGCSEGAWAEGVASSAVGLSWDAERPRTRCSLTWASLLLAVLLTNSHWGRGDVQS